MEEEQQKAGETNSSFMYYILGAIVLALIVGGVYFFRPKQNTVSEAPRNEITSPVDVTPAPGPITGLACERQWYNPVIGFAKYFLGVEGVDLLTTKKVICSFTVSVDGKVVATTSAESALTQAASRGGGTFQCGSPSLELQPNVPTVVDVMLKNDTNQIGSCTQTFILPQP